MRVVVAMSGGVDSSAVAALAVAAGHEVVGITLQLYDHGAATGRAGGCCAGQDIHDARRVADHLGIPHYVIDAQQAFGRAVMQDFADAYAAGETPVPCARCNQAVKFPELLAIARDLGAERLATGHYVRRQDAAAGPELHRARDEARDQSWFLFGLRPDELAASLFPLGDAEDKAAVRAAAARYALPVAAKPDSQDLCFVPSGRYAETVARLRPDAAAPGDIVDAAGRVLGRHAGVAHFTVGQSKRLGLPPPAEGGARPAVLALDAARRRVVVGPRSAGSRDVGLRAVNWLAGVPPAAGVRCAVKLRARDAFRPATVRCRADGGATVLLDAAAAAAPGQACVFYDGTRVLGGGFIRRPEVAAA